MKNRYFYQEEAASGEEGAPGGQPPQEQSSWLDSLPEDLKVNPALKDFKDTASLAKSFIDTQAHVGNSIRIPGEDAGDEDRKAFYDKLVAKAPNLMLKPDFDNADQSKEFYRSLGMPEQSSGYEMPQIEGVDFPEDRANFLREVAHENGITSKQFKSFMEKAIQADLQADQANVQAREAGLKSLKQEWGMAYDDRVDIASKIADATGAPDSLKNAIREGAVGADTYKWLYQISQQLGTETMNLANQGDAAKNVRLTPSEASAQINEIMNNKNHPYWISSHPDHSTAMNKMVELIRAKSAG